MDGARVELFDGTLIPLELETGAFLRRLRENPLNDRLRVGYVPQPVVTPPKPSSGRRRKHRPEEPTVESLTAELERDYARWDDLLENGGSDPTWADGINMNLVQGRIVANRRILTELCGDGMRPAILEREEPREMPNDYMAKPDAIRQAARHSLEVYRSNPTYLWCAEQAARIPAGMLKGSVIPTILGYVSGLETFIREDDLVAMRRHRNPDRYLDSFDTCRREIEKLLPAIRQSERTDRIYETLMAGDPAEPQPKTEQKPSLQEPAVLSVPTFAEPTKAALPTAFHPEVSPDDRIDYHLPEGTAPQTFSTPEKYQANVAAIRLLKQLESENRLATPEEQTTLASYVGWGGLADCFDPTNRHYEELKALLTPEEYEAAKESTLTAFYTPPVVMKAIYKALANMGFQGGNILEPACGVGNFIGALPEEMRGCRVYGVELDSISGRIAQQLYQKQNISVTGFENTAFPDSFFDVAVGNVPFGQFKVLDPKYNKYNFLIHDYFFAKTLDKVRPGGIVAMLTSKGTMDKENPAVRRYLAQRADLIGAIRLPEDTFRGNAGTEAVADILFFQKRDTMTTQEPDWVHLGTDENGIPMNRYFIDHPDMILGQMATESGPFGQRVTCKPYEDQPLSDLLDEAIPNLHAELTERADEPEALEDDSIPADPTVRNYSFTLVDGKVYYRQNSIMTPVQTGMTGENRIKGMLRLRDITRALIDAQLSGASDKAVMALQGELNEVYDSFTEKYGLINSRANETVFSDDSAYFLLCSLEILDDEDKTKLKRKADLFTKRTINPQVTVNHVDTASEALSHAEVCFHRPVWAEKHCTA